MRCCCRRPAIGAVTEVLEASDFYRESHGTIYRAALALYGKGEPVDAITLANELDERSELERVGGTAKIARARCGRPGDLERRALRAHRQGDGDAPGARSAWGRRSRGWVDTTGRDDDLVDRAEQIVFELAQER